MQFPSSNRLKFLLLVAVLFQSCSSFSITMMQEYQPPVKTSVKKLYSDRSTASRSSTTSTSNHNRSPSGSENKQQQQINRPRFSSSSSKSAHASGMAVPKAESTISRGVQSFERRMRDLVLGGQQKQRNEQMQQHSYQWNSNEIEAARPLAVPRNVKVVQCLNDYKEIVGNEQSKVVVVRFFATYCKACKAVAPHYYKLAQEHSDEAVFVDVPVTRGNSLLHQGLGIPSLPYAHIYHPEVGLVEELSFTRNHVAEVAKKLEAYIRGFCTLTNSNE